MKTFKIIISLLFLTSITQTFAMEDKRRPQRVNLPPCSLAAVMSPEDYASYSQTHIQEIEEQNKERERLELLKAKKQSAATTMKKAQQISTNVIINELLNENQKNRIELLQSYPIEINRMLLDQIAKKKELLDEYAEKYEITKLNALDDDILTVIGQQIEEIKPEKSEEESAEEEKID